LPKYLLINEKPKPEPELFLEEPEPSKKPLIRRLIRLQK
jgi:hypothetical protein